MKKLITIVFAGIFLLGCTKSKIPNEIEISKRFHNYQTKSKIITSEKKIKIDNQGNKTIYLIKKYDLNGDKDSEIIELRLGTYLKNGNLRFSPNPIIYGFDLNDNGKIEDYEKMIDDKQDGWNGNERWYLPLN